MRVLRPLLTALLALAPVAAASACADPPKAEFRELVANAPNIFTFQVTSAFYIRKSLGAPPYTEYVVGNIRVLDWLRGSGTPFKLVKYSFRRCGSMRISVGQIYVAATSQVGPLLQLWGTDQAILDLTQDFYHEQSKRSPAIDVIKAIIAGSPVPDDFPRDNLLTPLDVYPAPPPPPAQP